jgi:hypothetical protein
MVFAAGELLKASRDGTAPVELLDYIRHQVARTTGLQPHAVNQTVPLFALGLDAVLTVQLYKAMSADLELKFPIAMLMQGSSIEELAAGLCAFVRNEAGDCQLIPLRDRGTRAPVFCIHGLSCCQFGGHHPKLTTPAFRIPSG